MYESLSRVDLNLLVSFQVLMEEQNTTRAAKRMHITQSAMSKTLKRLRETFDDELFIRHGLGIKPTPKAEQVAELLAMTLNNIQEMIHPSQFDPGAVKAEISIGLPEPIALCVIPPLIDLLNEQAPRIVLSSHNLSRDYRAELHAGSLDFCIYQREIDPELVSTKIGQSEIVCILRQGHPLSVRESIAWKDLIQSTHINWSVPSLISSDWIDHTEANLHASGNTSCILDTTQLSLAVEVLLRSDALMLTTNKMVNIQAFADRLEAKPITGVPEEIEYVDIYLTQHKRSLNFPLHQWVTRQMTRLISDSIL